MLESDSAHGFESPRMIVPSTLTKEQRYPFFLLTASLLRSTAFDAMYSLSNSALRFNKHPADASDNWTSGKQWEIEAQTMFKTSLARMQVDMLYLSLGHTLYFHSAHNPHNAPATTEDPDTSLTFPSLGHRNVDALWFVSINVLCLLVYFSSRRYSTLEKRKANVESGVDGGYHDNLWITILFKKAWSLMKRLWQIACGIGKKLWSWLSAVWRKIQRH